MPTEMIEHQKVHAIVDNVNQALTDLHAGFALLGATKARLTATLGHETSYFDSLWQNRIYDSDLERCATESAAHITRNAWKYIVNQTGISSYMTEARQKALKDQIEKGDLPALTAENILGTLQSLAERTPELLQESLREVFDWLRPQYRNHGVGLLKTNQRFQLGPKVIIGYAVERYWTGQPWHLNSYREANFRSLGNVFALLDGQGVERYPNDLVTRWQHAWKESGGDYVDDQYFHCVAYKNKNLHVTFKRQDLVDAINKQAGDLSLPEETR